MKSKNSLHLRIPFHKQTSQFTCGPASLLMAMKFFQPALRLTKGLELDIWRESNLVESYGTSKEGLAVAAARRGFSAYTMGISRKHSFIDEISHEIPSVDRDVLELLYRDIRSKFRRNGTKQCQSSDQTANPEGASDQVAYSIIPDHDVIVRRKRGLATLGRLDRLFRRCIVR